MSRWPRALAVSDNSDSNSRGFDTLFGLSGHTHNCKEKCIGEPARVDSAASTIISDAVLQL